VSLPSIEWEAKCIISTALELLKPQIVFEITLNLNHLFLSFGFAHSLCVSAAFITSHKLVVSPALYMRAI
jgi:hypothetical protein